MIISVASGKGGTGKTTIATSLALSVGEVQFLDCDVEEPNGHIFLKPQINVWLSVGIPVPEVDQSKCTFCGKCAEICEFNAIVVIKKKVLFFPELCHGCGGCSYICPENAIKEVERKIGVIERGNSDKIDFIHGILNVGEPMAPPLIRQVKKRLHNNSNSIIDASPGTSCPVVEAVKESDFCLLVTEPTPFGLNDLKLAVEMLRKLTIPFGVVINCADIGDAEVEKYCAREDIPVLMSIPWDRKIAEAYSRGIPLIEALPEFQNRFSQLYSTIREESRKG
ncbi:MAG: ATP-binding protein [Deltaproteobacteria bacterium]|nr:ATP-binding protein [Deltaproteobacteria bacterium]